MDNIQELIGNRELETLRKKSKEILDFTKILPK